MTTTKHDTIDFIAYQQVPPSVILVMVEERPWGDRGALLPDLQAKLETYLNYVVLGQLRAGYPAVANHPVTIELRCAAEPGERERTFLDIVMRRHLLPENIAFRWRVIGAT